MFRASPGCYEVWHVKDLIGLASLHGITEEIERMRAAKIFAQGVLAGMKHYYVEQDSAPQSGDSLAEAARSYRGLMEVLG